MPEAPTRHGIDRAFLVQQYVECNRHIVESDKKRDFALGLYATGTLAFYAAATKLSPDPELFFLGVLGLNAIGIALGFLFTMYRGWHGFYVIQASAIQRILHENTSCEQIDGKFIGNIDYRFNQFASVEFITIAIHHVVFLMNAVVALESVAGLGWRWLAVGVIVLLGLAEVGMHFRTMRRLDAVKHADQLGTRYLWMLRGLSTKLDRLPADDSWLVRRPDRTANHVGEHTKGTAGGTADR